MPTKWERMVEKERLALLLGIPPTKVIRCDDAVKLLARQHRAFERMVRRCQCDPEDGQMVENGYNQAKADILSALREMGKK